MTPPPPGSLPGPDPVFPLFLDVLRKHGRVSFVLADDLDGRCGMVNFDQAVIVLDAGNDCGAMRSTIAHELGHLDCPECPDDEIEQMTAERLVPLTDALAAAHAADSADMIRHVANRLGVDTQLVRARIRDIPTQGTADGVG